MILVTGKPGSRPHARDDSSENGFTLIEIMVAVAILAILLSIASLNIPNHAARYWKNDLDYLVGSLNAAQDEATIAGQVVLVRIDQRGWRFGSMGNRELSIFSGAQNKVRPSALLPDIYQPHAWSSAMSLEAIEFTLGDELFGESLQLIIARDSRVAILRRDTGGHFYWING